MTSGVCFQGLWPFMDIVVLFVDDLSFLRSVRVVVVVTEVLTIHSSCVP